MKKFLKIFISIIVIALIGILTIYLAPKVYALREEENKIKFMNYVSDLGFYGVFFVIAMNALQVIIAILPGEVFEIVSGLMYGPWWGLLIVEIGIGLASFIVISILRMLKVNESKFKKKIENKKLFKALSDSKRLEIIIFFITIIPALPKDLLVYMIPFTDIKLSRFLIINAIARIPSIISSTFFGSSLLSGNYLTAIIIFSVEAAIGILGIIFNKKIMEFIYRKNKTETSE